MPTTQAGTALRYGRCGSRARASPSFTPRPKWCGRSALDHRYLAAWATLGRTGPTTEAVNLYTPTPTVPALLEHP